MSLILSSTLAIHQLHDCVIIQISCFSVQLLFCLDKNFKTTGTEGSQPAQKIRKEEI
jgi:hypothetical protein